MSFSEREDWLKAVPREFKTCQSCFYTQHIVMNLADKLRQNNQRQQWPQSTFGTNWKTKQLIPYTIKIALSLTFICNSGIFYVTLKKNQKLFDPKRRYQKRIFVVSHFKLDTGVFSKWKGSFCSFFYGVTAAAAIVLKGQGSKF